MPPPGHLHDASHVKLDDDKIDYKCLLPSASMRERGRRTSFSPSAPVAMDITDLVYNEIVAAQPEIADVLLPEYMRYYTTAGIWMRIVALKSHNQQPMTQMERIAHENIKHTSFVFPQPILMQFQTLGNVLTPTNQYPQFPPMPSAALSQHGGFCGHLIPPGAPGADDNIHNLYEELPCLGVTAEAIQKAVSDDPPGVYETVINYEGRQPNQNLLGFKPLGIRGETAKDLAFDAGITEDHFPCHPPQSALSLYHTFSTIHFCIISTTTSFKNTGVGRQRKC